MKAIAVYPGERDVRLIDREPPRITAPTQVLMRVLDVGICGTDREICAMEYGTPPSGADHLVLGHEALAVVETVGRDVTRVRPGDVVVPMVRRPCRHAHCPSCRIERQDFCFTGEFTERGINSAHGFMTELVVEDQKWLNVVPGHLRELGVLVEPLTIAEKGLIQVRSLQQRLPWQCATGGGHCHRAVVLGAGPVGLLGAMALVAEGFDTWVYSRGGADGRAAVVAAMGAHFISSEQVPPAGLTDVVGNIDLIYEATGASVLAFEAMAELGTNGVFVFTGVPGRKAPIEVDTDRIMRNLVLKNQVVLGTVNAGRDAFEAAVADLASFAERWPDALASFISGRHDCTGYRELLLGRPGGIKHVIRFAD